ncbi:MAG TPA: GntR family transcriptional regulator [Anaerolineales bacterium]|nr:GntR family transcriptional regulator [Anaerolineales bacterium]
MLHDQIREHLIAAILKGDYNEGERIVETRVARQLGVSQGAVREALRQLEVLGFLESEPYSGTYVRTHTIDDLMEIYPVRAALESLGARLALPHLSDEQIDKLEKLVGDMVRLSESGDVRGMVERNFEFHKAIINASGNSMLIRSWGLFQFSYWTTVTTTELQSQLAYLAQRHYAIIEALRSRDPQRAARALHEHILELRQMLSQREAETTSAPSQFEA